MTTVPASAPPIIRGRTITGMSAVLLPFHPDHSIDWPGFEAHLDRTIAAGIVPAVNMDTGFGPVLSPDEREHALQLTQRRATPFVAGAHVTDVPGAPFSLDGYQREFATIATYGGTPIVFPSHGFAELGSDELIAAHTALGHEVDSFYGFELGRMFHPAGRIFTLDEFEALLAIPSLRGAKHSSLERDLEWQRLAVRNRVRPEFLVLTGNDLAIDMVQYGSDYLLGLSTFAPDAFAARDRAWAAGDDRTFLAFNDILQYLGHLTFRAPVPGYRHDAAMFLKLRGWIDNDTTHAMSVQRPDSDRALLEPVAARIAELLAETHVQ